LGQPIFTSADLTPMKRTTKFLAALCALAALPVAALAQTASATTAPVGFVTITTLSNSDTIFSTPLAQPAVFSGSVSTLSSATITATGTPGWTTNAFQYVAGTQSNTYYLRFTTGAMAGNYFTVTANTSNSLTVNLAGNLLTSVAVGDQFSIIPYWTLGTLFPASAAGTEFQASTPFARNTEVLFPDQVSLGVNLAPASIFYFINSAWTQAGSTSGAVANDTVLPPDSYVIIRNQAFTGSITVMGGVVTTLQSTPLNSYPTHPQDNFVAVTYPVPTTLNNLGLAAAFVPSTPFSRNDELLVFDNTVATINRSPSAIYFYQNGAWQLAGGNGSNSGSVVLNAGTGFIVRKAVNASGPSTTDWIFNP
jgi:uncharacterized protein (TIGR02597 family)